MSEDMNLNQVNDEVQGSETPTVQETSAAPEVKTQKFGKKHLLIGIIAAVVVIVAVIVAAAAASSPTTLVAKGLSNSVDALKASDTVVFASKVAEGGSVEVLGDMETLMDFPVDGIVSLKLYTAAAKAALVADFEVEGDSILDVSAYFDAKNIAVASDVLFGKDAYGIKLTNLAEKFNDSEFGPRGDYSLDFEMPETVDSGADLEKAGKDFEKIAKDMTKNLLKSVQKHTEVEKENETLSFSDATVKATAVTVRFDSKSVPAILVDMVDYLRSSKDLKNFLYDYAEYLSPVLTEADLLYGSFDDPEELIDELYDQLDDLSDRDLEDMAESLEETLDDADFELAVTFYIAKSGKQLVGAEIEAEADGDKISGSVLAGPSWKNLEEISVRLDDGYTLIRASYVVETNDKNELSAKLKVREDDESLLTGEFTWDKKKGDFEAEVTDEWEDTYVLEGSIEATSKTVTVVLDSFYDEYYDEETDLGITVTFSTSDKMPKMPSYTDILDLSADDIEDLIYDLQDVVQDMGSVLYNFF